MKDENGLHFLGWAILANVTTDQYVSAACAVIACVYCLCAISALLKRRGEQ
ncbi:hypothetical protein KLEP174_gp39 [Pseudomonas phage vB_PcuM_ KLEP17-4]|nr:hypothetical protein KLEP174_gp39 [Pseudomonas phage vB_PcuM_ KLEP17-4]